MPHIKITKPFKKYKYNDIFEIESNFYVYKNGEYIKHEYFHIKYKVSYPFFYFKLINKECYINVKKAKYISDIDVRKININKIINNIDLI